MSGAKTRNVGFYLRYFHNHFRKRRFQLSFFNESISILEMHLRDVYANLSDLIRLLFMLVKPRVNTLA